MQYYVTLFLLGFGLNFGIYADQYFAKSKKYNKQQQQINQRDGGDNGWVEGGRGGDNGWVEGGRGGDNGWVEGGRGGDNGWVEGGK